MDPVLAQMTGVAPASDAPAPSSYTPKGTIMDRAVCLVVERGKFGNSKKAPIAKIMEIARKEANGHEGAFALGETVDRRLLSASKKLLVSPELKAIASVDGEIFQYLDKVALPSMFKSGVHLIPIPLVEKVETDLREFRTRRAAQVARFLEVYPDQMREIETKLGELFNPLDYPSVDKLKTMFVFEWQYVTFGVPGSLKAVKASLFEEERKKYAAKLTEAADECRMAMRAGLAEVVAHMVDRLTVDETDPLKPKKKVFKAKTVENVSEFLATFEMKNITDDADLGVLVSQARELMNGVDPKLLREDDLVRRKLHEGFAAISASLETMGVDRHSRAIDLDES